MDSNQLLPHSNFHPSDAFVAILTIGIIPAFGWLAHFLNANAGLFVSLGAIFGMAYTAYRWIIVYRARRRKTHKTEKELKSIVDKHLRG